MKKVISIIILLVMFTAVISVKAEWSKVLEEDSEYLELDYSYRGEVKKERSETNVIYVIPEAQVIIIYEKDSRLKEIYNYPNKQEFYIAAMTLLNEMRFSDDQYWVERGELGIIYTSGNNYTQVLEVIKELMILSGGNV